MNKEPKIGVVCFLIGLATGVISLAVYLAIPFTSGWATIPLIAISIIVGILIGIGASIVTLCTLADSQNPDGKPRIY